MKLVDHLIDEAMVAEVSDMEPDRFPGRFPPAGDPPVQRADGQERRDTLLEFPLPFGEVVDHADLVAGVGKMHCGRPPEIAVTTQDKNSHGNFSFVFSLHSA